METADARAGRGHRINVLDATVLIDYLDGPAAIRAVSEAHGGDQTRWIAPVPALAEYVG